MDKEIQPLFHTPLLSLRVLLVGCMHNAPISQSVVPSHSSSRKQGMLAIGAAALGAGQVLAFDLDQDALETAQENVRGIFGDSDDEADDDGAAQVTQEAGNMGLTVHDSPASVFAGSRGFTEATLAGPQGALPNPSHISL